MEKDAFILMFKTTSQGIFADINKFSRIAPSYEWIEILLFPIASWGNPALHTQPNFRHARDISKLNKRFQIFNTSVKDFRNWRILYGTVDLLSCVSKIIFLFLYTCHSSSFFPSNFYFYFFYFETSTSVFLPCCHHTLMFFLFYFWSPFVGMEGCCNPAEW